MVYDLYDGRQWWSSASTIALMEPNEFPTAPAFQERRIVQQTITVLQETRSLLAAPSPLWFSVPVKSEHLSFPIEGDLWGLDIYGATSRRVLAAGELYQSVSTVSGATKEMLRQAGDDYPSWLPRVYLEVPANVPGRVAALAHEIAQNMGSPYDQAEALETYLRGLTYNQNVEAPPPGRDAADYFLFDSREGYCNYFASSMVLMARSLGIPARVAAGYAPGEYDAQADVYTILGTSAHSWPQLYFPGYGWVDFEPTPSQPVVGRLEAIPTSGRSDEPSTGPQLRDSDDGMDPSMELLGGDSSASGLSVADGSRFPAGIAVVLGVAAVASISLLLLWALPRRSWTATERLYANLVALARVLGVRPRLHETPSEYGERLARALPEARPEVESIVQAFYRVRYHQGWGAEDQELRTVLQRAWATVIGATGRALARRLAYPSRPVT
jgi:transglutaminase-like putative cysteine protease